MTPRKVSTMQDIPQHVDDIKAVDLKSLLAAAHDANDSVLMAQAILAHSASVDFPRTAIRRMWRIGYDDGLPAPSEAKGLREICAVLLEMDEVAS